MMFKIAAPLILLSLLSACAGGPREMPLERIERALRGAPGQAQPGKVVAAELAFARAAREEGQWTAFRKYSAGRAILHGEGGSVDAAAWLKGRKDPPTAVQWGPRTVWMSCDGKVAVSQGRFRDPDGQVGTFVTVWQQQSDEEYRWIYDAGGLDNPQPAPRPVSASPSEDEIIVKGESPIRGLVADCPQRRGGTVPPPPAPFLAVSADGAITLSGDGTLRWRWLQLENGDRRFIAQYLTEGAWQTALDQTFAAAKPE